MIHFSWLKKDLYKTLSDPSIKFVWVFLMCYLILIKNVPKVIILLFFLLIYVK